MVPNEAISTIKSILTENPHGFTYHSTQTKDTYYNQLRSAIAGVPLHDFLAILTDANARLGPENVLFSYNASTNDNDKRLLEVMEEY